MAKNSGLILVALFIDGLQAAISWGIAMIASFPGTVGGASAGAAAGNEIAGEVGAAIGGAVLGFFGSYLNVAAVVTIPFGMMVGFAVNAVITLGLGYGFLFMLLLFFGFKPHKRIGWSGLELVPGLNNIPCWTFFTISCIWAQSKSKKARKGVLGVAALALVPVRNIMTIKENTPGNDGLNNVPQPTSARELIRASEKQFPERAPMRDIRPNKPNAQAA